MMTSKNARERWNAEHYKQMNISVDKELAEAFKALCSEEGVSVAGAIKSFMDKNLGIATVKLSDNSGAARPSRGKRRREVTAVIARLETIMADEECYLDRIPENLRYSVWAEAAAHSIAMLSEAIDLLADAY
jgi:hypothetical protein